MTRIALLFAFTSLAVPAVSADASELSGSLASMRRQHAVALENELAFLRTSREVRAEVAEGGLVRVEPNDDVVFASVSQPFARAEVRTFVQRLGAQYRAATGSPLVVTSLTRPETAQPGNAHRLSVHPAGMAVDLRVPAARADRAWLEKTLLSLEDSGVLDVTRERHPPHYHVAIYPDAYRAHVARLDSIAATGAPKKVPETPKAEPVVQLASASPSAAPAPDGPPFGGVMAMLASGLLLAAALVGRRRRA